MVYVVTGTVCSKSLQQNNIYALVITVKDTQIAELNAHRKTDTDAAT